jgi:tape measure domain-containing protein
MNLEFFIKLREMVSSGLVKMAETARKTTNAIKVTNDTLGNSYDAIKRKINELEAAIGKSTSVKYIREARRELSELQRMARLAPGNLSGSGGGGLLGGILPAVGVAAALSFGGSTVSSARNQDSTARAVNFATNGQGAQAIAGVKAINNQYGLSNEAGIEGFKTLAGSVRSLGFPLEETLRLYKAVGAAAGAMGVNSEAQKGIFLALGQIASKGTVSAEELRGQIGERLPGAFGIAAKAMGMTEQQLGKMMQKGELLSKDFLPKFATEMQKTFGLAAEQASTGAQAVYERYNNTIFELTNTIGNALLPTVTKLAQAFIDTVGWVKENWDWFGMLVAVLGTAVGAYALVTAAQTSLNIAMSLNPVGAIIAGIAALVVGLIYAYNRFEWFRNKIQQVWEVLKVIFEPSIKDLITQFESLKIVAEGLWDVFKWVFEKIGTLFEITFGPIKDFFMYITGWIGEKVSGSNIGQKVQNALKQLEVNQDREKREKMRQEFLNNPALHPKQSPISIPTNQSSTTNSVANDTAQSITSGGPRTINIYGVKFAEKIEVHATTVEKGLDNLKDTLDEYLLRLLNSGAAVQ